MVYTETQACTPLRGGLIASRNDTRGSSVLIALPQDQVTIFGRDSGQEFVTIQFIIDRQ